MNFCYFKETGLIKQENVIMKIIVNMACGLANRMFQYTYYLFLKGKGYNVEVDFYQSAKLAHEKVAWNEVFPKAKIVQASSWEVLKLGGSSDLISKIRRKYLPLFSGVVNMPTAFDVELPEEGKKDKYIIGVFQNAEMVEAVEDEVKCCFEFQPFVDERNRKLEEEMLNCESVAIHVRKGKDYMQRVWYQNTCPVEYYKKAIGLIKTKVHNPKFYVFTDNPEWVRENFKGMEYGLVEGNPASGWGSHFDMQLMSKCKHNIISNSTYSWWSAFLNAYPKKIVIGPKIWFSPGSCKDFTSERTLCKKWLAI